MSNIKFISWNVNGIRACVRNGFERFLAEEKPDVLGLQEIKISHATREKENFDFAGYDEWWNPAERPGYAGTATLIATNSKLKVENYKEGIGQKEFDIEGRVQTIEFEKFYFVNVYFPNSNHELSRLQYKLDFNNALLKYLKKLEKGSSDKRGKPVVICGDFNVAHREIDLARPKDNVGNAGFTPEERAWMDRFIDAGFVDTYRLINGDKVEYSWWSYMRAARDRNIGWRIDYFLVSDSLKSKVKDAFILTNTFGSDHCPVGIILSI